jgi:hypothetical protein
MSLVENRCGTGGMSLVDDRCLIRDWRRGSGGMSLIDDRCGPGGMSLVDDRCVIRDWRRRGSGRGWVTFDLYWTGLLVNPFGTDSELERAVVIVLMTDYVRIQCIKLV